MAALFIHCLISLLMMVPVSQSSSSPDLWIVIGDDIGYQDQIDAATPALDVIANQGTRFTRCYAMPVCSPSRWCLYFGKWNLTGGAVPCGPTIEPVPSTSLVSLAELKSSLPAFFFGKWHCGPNPVPTQVWEDSPLVHGFDLFNGTPTNPNGCGGSGYSNWVHVENHTSSLDTSYMPRVMRDEALSHVTFGRGPRMIVFSSNLAHQPFHTPPADMLYAPPPQILTPLQKYRYMIQSLDFALNQLISPDDWVIFIGDNGTPPINAPNPNRAKGTTYERGIHVPLIVRAPGFMGGIVDDRLCHVVDVYATVAMLLKSTKVNSDGISLNSSETHDYILSGTITDRAVRSHQYKLRIDDNEFYDLVNDPTESINLYKDPAYAELIAEHLAWFNSLKL